MKKNFKISSFEINPKLESKLRLELADYLNWPIVYFLKNETSKDSYVGETTDMLTRLLTHSKSVKKENLNSVNIILSDFFNKSATLDLEANLIRYLSADGIYKLQNGNLGITNHQYYNQKEIYWNLFKNVWNELRTMGIARHSLEYIDNSDLFKYSPYKSLSKEQVKGLKTILYSLLQGNSKISLIKGGAGTGKTILAIFLIKLLKTDLKDFNFSDFDDDDEEVFELVKKVRQLKGELNIALVIPMASFRKTVSNVFKNIKGLSANMVISPSKVVTQKFDLLIVDEAHRLRKRTNLGTYFKQFDDICKLLGLDKTTASELDWIKIQATQSILFYDESQSIKPSDVNKEDFEKLSNLPSSRVEELKTQLRVKGGNEYVNMIRDILDNKNISNLKKIDLSDYDFYLFEDINEMIHKIRNRDQKFGLSRLIAGFAWEWVSKKSKDKYDITINNTKLKWNSVSEDWVNSKNAINEVGCIHTTQGYDLNYAGIIIGPELDYDFKTNEFIIYKERYKDKNGKNTIEDEDLLKEYILNIYKTILLRGIYGTYIYVCNENLRKYFRQFTPVYSKNTNQSIVFSDKPGPNYIPYYDLKIAAGSFSEIQQSSEIKYLKLNERYANENYFACRVFGESMNNIIPNGSICLFEKYTGGSRNGKICLVESSSVYDTDLGAQYTIKEYLSKKIISEEGWEHLEIHLIPRSSNPNYKTLTLVDDETIDFRVIGIFVKVLSPFQYKILDKN